MCYIIIFLIFTFLNRIAHAPRGPYFKVRGDLILITADLKHSMSQILPLNQDIVPVSFKRHLSYSGAYLEEFIEKAKVQIYFEFFKKMNHLYKVYKVLTIY